MDFKKISAAAWTSLQSRRGNGHSKEILKLCGFFQSHLAAALGYVIQLSVVPGPPPPLEADFWAAQVTFRNFLFSEIKN